GKVLRVWADGKPLDLTSLAYRIYPGNDGQSVDPLIAAKEAAAPAYRGTAYVVFERLPLANFGNRIPQLSFELVRPIGELEKMTRAVTLIPGSTEFGYEHAAVTQVLGPGQYAPENRHVAHAVSDIEASLDELQAICPSLERVALVVAWFGDDLRAGSCEIYPAVDDLGKDTSGATWSVDGLERAGAREVTRFAGRPAYGGTPSDQSVIDLIAELKARGLKVTLYPFVMMDIPAGNTLPDPHTGAAPQPPYPWRGRITCDPAPSAAGTVDGTSAAATQVNAFFTGGDWNYRRMVLHYAGIATAAGGVDAFLIGSELPGLTRLRSASGVYPAVNALVSLAAEVKAALGAGTVVTYGADWTEYGAHVVDAAADEVRFPLDPLWASPDIDAVGIDYYAPLADWRDGADHLDRALTDTIYDKDYLAGNLRRGEDYDWYYASGGDREAQARTEITDGLGKPWLFRAKDIWSWWSEPHYERVGGAELGTATAWLPQGKPIWLTEIGCPAVDKGANQPSVFPDPKSSENFNPYFSSGRRDDLIQRRMLEAVLRALDPAFGAGIEMNPVSSVYGARMLAPSSIHLWTWDARPYPVFPAALEVWSDGANWQTGHWLTGRLGSAPLDALVAALCADSGVTDVDASGLRDTADGYLVDRPMPPRAMIDPLALMYGFDAAEDGSTLRFIQRGGEPVAEYDEDALVLQDDAAPVQLTRAQETELPREISLGFTDIGGDYRRAAIASRRLVGGAVRVSHADLAVVTNDAAAGRRADIWLQDLWASRERANFTLPPSALGIATGDVIGLTSGGRRRLVEVQQVSETESRVVTARSIDPEVFNLPLLAPRRRAPLIPVPVAPVHALALDLPSIDASEPPVLTRLAVFAEPWPGAVAVWRSSDGLSFSRFATALAPSIIGETLDDLPAGPVSRFDRHHNVRVRLYGGALASLSDMRTLGGGNAAAVQNAGGAWEVIQFANAELVDDRTYRLSRLIRGQAGSEWAIGLALPAGAPFVMLDGNLVALARGPDTLERPMQLRLIVAGRDTADPATLALEVTPQSVALEPLSPVHLKARRSDAGVALSWIRRTRSGGDSWSAEVPLGEEREAYEADILDGASVVRTLTGDTRGALYAAADEIADFGAPQSTLSIAVYQLSATVGRGVAAQVTLTP
ncbi:MAG: baseplate multidomain protein megatron, partial [Pseudolabrys sp.]